MPEGPDADIATAYVAWMAQRQIDGGAAYLDLNVDEIDPAVAGRLAAMIWLVNAVGPVSTVPLSIDSSDAAVLEAGLDAIDPVWAGGAIPMVNSASVERPEVLDLCRERGTPVVLSCTGRPMPSGTDDRVERAEQIIGIALDLGLPADSLFVDPLVIPIGVDPMAGQASPRRRVRDPGALPVRHPYHRWHQQHLLRAAGAPPHHRHLPGPVRPGRSR